MINQTIERFFDILFSIIAIIIFSPIFLLISIILKCSGEGEIFFFQDRVGLNGKSIKLFKFVTMLKNSENIGTGTVTLKDDPRILPFGKFLRKTKLNELPQLFNILNGDMSVIGPRPQTRRCFDAFPNKSQIIIISTRPGLSGIGSIIFRDEEKMIGSHGEDFYDKVIMPYKGELEEWYVSNKSISMYFTLITYTVWVILFPNSRYIWRIYKSLPKPPPQLTNFLGNID